MALHPYTVELTPGRSEQATRRRLDTFLRYIDRLGGEVSDTWVHPQSSTYVLCMAQVWIAEEQVETILQHHTVRTIRKPPRPDLGTLDMSLEV